MQIFIVNGCNAYIFENGDFFFVFEKIRVHTDRINTVFARLYVYAKTILIR